MKSSIALLLLVVSTLTPVVYGQTVEYTKRAKNEVRDGPGNYYSLLYVFPPQVPVVPLKNKDGWVNIRFGGAQGTIESEIAGWMSKNCLVDTKPSGTSRDLDIIIGSPKASPSSVAAAIRGFALRYGKTSEAVVDSLSGMCGKMFLPRDYFPFRDGSPGFKTMPKGLKRFEQSGSYLGEYDVTMDEQGVGLGVASRVAAQGLVDNKALLRYLNLLGAYLSEATGAYDAPFAIFVVRGSQVNAIAVPGGYIFITEPMLNLCQSEAELAGVLAHEMSHIILRHGVKEIGARIMNIKMDAAMRELDEETGEEADTTEQDLEDYALAAFEGASKPRLQSYEEDADRGAVLILARAGYDPSAVARMVLRIRDAVKQNEQIQEENPFAHLDFQNRFDKVRKFIDEQLSEVKGVTNQERFTRNVKQ